MTSLRKLLTVGVAACLLFATTGAAGGSSADAKEPVAQFEAEIADFVDYRNGLLVSNDRAAKRPATLGAAAQSRLDLAEDQLPKLESLMREMGEEYVDSKSEITILKKAPIDSVTTEVLYREFTTIAYKHRPGEEARPENTSYSADYLATFTRGQDKSWHLESVTLVNDGAGIPPMTEPIEGREIASSLEEFEAMLEEMDRATARAAFGPNGAPDPVSMAAQSDAVDATVGDDAAFGFGLGEGVMAASPLILAAVSYQMTDISAADAYGDVWWDGFNPDFKNYGTDCTNFVSQIMEAGGWAEKTGWYRSDNAWWYNHVWPNVTHLENNSWTWSGAQNFFDFARGHRTTSRNGIWNLRKGDVLQLDQAKDGSINHSMFVEARWWNSTLGKYEPYVTYHSGPTNYRSLSNLLASSTGWWWYTHRTH